VTGPVLWVQGGVEEQGGGREGGREGKELCLRLIPSRTVWSHLAGLA
jgi:hypothetical protein